MSEEAGMTSNQYDEKTVRDLKRQWMERGAAWGREEGKAQMLAHLVLKGVISYEDARNEDVSVELLDNFLSCQTD